jgi:phosphatidate phosphatase
MAFFTGLSRVSDNKHHPTDVLAGALLGTVVAVFTFHYLNRFYRRYNYTSPAKYELTNLNEDPNNKELSNLNSKDQKRCSGAKLI